MDPGLCRDHLAGLLGEESALLGELEELLERERHVLESSDIAALEATTRARQERMGALARIEDQRRSLCGMHGYSPDRAGLDQLIAWCDPHGTLMPRLRECAERAVRCRDFNDRNAMIVGTRLKRVQGMLDSLTGSPVRSDTYDSQTLKGRAGRPGRILGAA